MNQNFAPAAIGSALGFQCFNSALNLGLVPPPPEKYGAKDRHKWRNSCTSLLHGLIMSGIVMYCIFTHPELWENPHTYYTIEADFGLAVLLGYFIYDFVDLLRHSSFLRQFALLLHHVIMGVSVCTLRYERFIGVFFIGLLSEVSAVFLHSRLLMLMYGISKQSASFKIHRFFNTVFFISFRITALLYANYTSFTVGEEVSPFLRRVLPFFTVTMITINLVLFRRLIISDFLTADKKDDYIMDST